jgi:hypothetical protein
MHAHMPQQWCLFRPVCLPVCVCVRACGPGICTGVCVCVSVRVGVSVQACVCRRRHARTAVRVRAPTQTRVRTAPHTRPAAGRTHRRGDVVEVRARHAHAASAHPGNGDQPAPSFHRAPVVHFTALRRTHACAVDKRTDGRSALMPAGARGRTRKTRVRTQTTVPGEPTCRVLFCYRCADHSKSPLTAKPHTRTHEGVDRRAARPCNQTCAPACTDTRAQTATAQARARPNFIQTQRFERVLMQGSCDPSQGAFSCVCACEPREPRVSLRARVYEYMFRVCMPAH